METRAGPQSIVERLQSCVALLTDGRAPTRATAARVRAELLKAIRELNPEQPSSSGGAPGKPSSSTGPPSSSKEGPAPLRMETSKK